MKKEKLTQIILFAVVVVLLVKMFDKMTSGLYTDLSVYEYSLICSYLTIVALRILEFVFNLRKHAMLILRIFRYIEVGLHMVCIILSIINVIYWCRVDVIGYNVLYAIGLVIPVIALSLLDIGLFETMYRESKRYGV